VLRRRQVLSIIVSLAAAAVIGSGLAIAVSNLDANSSGDAKSRYDEQRSVSTFAFSPGPETGTARREIPVPVAAESARRAVESFLTAEVDGEFDASWRLLSDADRELVEAPAIWRRAHATLPAMTSFDVVVETDRGVVADVGFVPELDETLGLVPARARLELETVVEGGGHRVVWSSRRTTPITIDAGGAVTATRSWVSGRLDCDRPGNEWRGGLVGNGAPGAAEALCGQESVRVADEAQRLEDRYGIEPFVAAFGPEVAVWARTVQIECESRTSSCVDLDVVLAPIGEQWLVVGAIPLSSERSG
jgi:hypothetical protein